MPGWITPDSALLSTLTIPPETVKEEAELKALVERAFNVTPLVIVVLPG
jgi:hypothetical protein